MAIGPACKLDVCGVVSRSMIRATIDVANPYRCTHHRPRTVRARMVRASDCAALVPVLRDTIR